MASDGNLHNSFISAKGKTSQNHREPLVSVILLNYNGEDFLGKCLASLAKSSYHNFEVILVDNCSTDKSCISGSQKFDLNIKFVLNRKNYGFAEGNNIGAGKSHGEYLVFLNVDTLVDSGWLTELVSVMENDRSVGSVQSNLLNYEGEFIDGTGDFIDAFCYGYSRQHGEKLGNMPHFSFEIFSARGAAMMIRKSLFDEVGGFDAAYFMLCEDVDLGWRIRLHGFNVLFVPSSIVYHFGSGLRKSQQSIARSYYYNSRNSLVTLIKNYSLKNLVIYGSGKVLFQFVSFILAFPFAAKRHYNLSRLTGIGWVLLNLKSIWESRVIIQSRIRRVSDGEIKRFMIRKNLSMLEFAWALSYKKRLNYSEFISGVTAAA